MNRLAATLIMVTPLTLPPPAWAGGGVPEPTSSRIVLHGVDCSIDSGTTCDDERPVFDEAIISVPNSAVVVIETRVAEGVGGEPTSALPRACADAVREYFISAGVSPDQVEIQGSTEMPDLLNWIQPVEVQLARRFQ